MEPSAGFAPNLNPAFEAAAGRQEQDGDANARGEERREAEVVALVEWCSHRDVRLGQKKKGKKERNEEDAEVREWRVMAEEMAERVREGGGGGGRRGERRGRGRRRSGGWEERWRR